MKESEIIENGLYRLRPKDNEELRTWCRHNLLIAHKENNEFIFTDTYWGNGSESTNYKFNDIKNQIEFVFDLNHSLEVHEKEYYQYDEKDRFFIPMGAHSKEHLVDSRSKKSKTNIIELLEYTIEDKKRDIEILNRNIERHTSDLKNIKSGGDPNNIYI